MRKQVYWNYCTACQRTQPFCRVVPKLPDDNPLLAIALFPIAGVIFVLRYSFLPDRCVVCFRWIYTVLERPINRTQPQSDEEINNRLSPFSRRLINYCDRQEERVDEASVGTVLHRGRAHIEPYLASGYPVGGRHEKIVHVTQLRPKNGYDGYVGRFFYLLFSPLTYWHYRSRLRTDPNAYFFPPNYPYAGRVVLTDKRLFLCYHLNGFYASAHSFPIESIREVRQSGASVVVQLAAPELAAVKVHVGAEIGELLRTIHASSTIRVRDPDREWSPSER